MVRPWLDLSTAERLDLVASYLHFAGTDYLTPGRAGEKGTGRTKAGELFDGIESLVLVSEGKRTDPLWIVKGTRR